MMKGLKSICSTDCYTCNKNMVKVKSSHGQMAQGFWIIEFLHSDTNLTKMVGTTYTLHLKKASKIFTIICLYENIYKVKPIFKKKIAKFGPKSCHVLVPIEIADISKKVYIIPAEKLL